MFYIAIQFYIGDQSAFTYYVVGWIMAKYFKKF